MLFRSVLILRAEVLPLGVHIVVRQLQGVLDIAFLRAVDAFAEMKAPGGKLRPLQAARIERLRALGFRVYVIDDIDQIGGVLDEISAT